MKKDYLFWCYPLIYLGLLVMAIKWDNGTKVSAAITDVDVDTSITNPAKTWMIHDLKNAEYIDSFSFIDSTSVLYDSTIIEWLNSISGIDVIFTDDGLAENTK